MVVDEHATLRLAAKACQRVLENRGLGLQKPDFPGDHEVAKPGPKVMSCAQHAEALERHVGQHEQRHTLRGEALDQRHGFGPRPQRVIRGTQQALILASGPRQARLHAANSGDVVEPAAVELRPIGVSEDVGEKRRRECGIGAESGHHGLGVPFHHHPAEVEYDDFAND